MPYESLLTIFCVVFLIAMVGLFWLLLRQQNQRSEDHKAFLSAATELAIQRADQLSETLETQMAHNQSAFETLVRQMETQRHEQQAEIQRQQELWQRSADLTLTRALDGSNKAQERAQGTLQSTLTMLGTKDPLAYQQVQAGWGAPIAGDDPSKPYTAADDAVLEQIRTEAQAQAAVDDVMARLTGLTRSTASGSTSDPSGPRPYDLAAAE